MTKVHVGFLFLFTAVTAFADIDMVSQSGRWAAACPPVICSAPGDTWSYSFITNSVVISPLGFEIPDPISDFEYSINAVIVPSFTDKCNQVHREFWTQDGGFTLFCNSSGGVGFGIDFGMWVQLFGSAQKTDGPAD